MNKKDWPVFAPSGAQLISDERQRQIANEGWTAAYDDGHSRDELARAAVCYATPEWARRFDSLDIAPENWPWDYKWWKPTPDDRIRELAKAGALIAAPIDRLLRLKETP